MTKYIGKFPANSGIKQRACMRCMMIKETSHYSRNFHLDRSLSNNIYTVQVLGSGIVFISEFTREPMEFKRNYIFNGGKGPKDDELIQKVVRYYEKHRN